MKTMTIPKAFDTESNCIVFSADEQFIPLTSVAIQSIIETANEKDLYDILVLHCGVGEEQRSVVEKMADGYDHISIRFFDLTDIFRDRHLFTENREAISEATYYRLAIPYILSSGYSKALYLDGDMVIREDIQQLLHMEIGENLIGAVRDYWGICNCYIPGDPRRAYREKIGLTDIDGYFIGAPVLIHLEHFRQRYSLDEVLELAGSYPWQQHDQDVLNVLCRGAIHYIDPTWGYMTDYGYNHYLPSELLGELEAVKEPRIVHYGGKRKPTKTAHVEYDMVFWNVAKQTPYIAMLLNSVVSKEYRAYVVKQLYGDAVFSDPTAQGGEWNYKGILLGSPGDGYTRYRKIQIKDGTLILEGMTSFFWADPDSKIEVQLEINGTRYPVQDQYRDDGFSRNRKEWRYRGEAFAFEWKLADPTISYEIKIIALCNGKAYKRTAISFEKFCPFGRKYRTAYYAADNWSVKRDGAILRVQYQTDRGIRELEKAFQKELKNRGSVAERKAILARTVYFLLKKFKKKPIWLISDRLNKADDNGEAFFKYLNEQKKQEVQSFFILQKESPDFQRLKSVGSVIPAYSFRHKLLYLLADVLVSSQSSAVWRNPFPKHNAPYQNILCNKPFIFLQHGVISNDSSSWLSRKKQYFTGFVTTAHREYDSIRNGNYHYGDEVWLTGLPRFDNLRDRREKIITVMPTWRRYLAVRQDQKTGEWSVKRSFSDSEYVRFYRALMNSKELKTACERYGYSIQFKVHPCFRSNASQFAFDSDVKIVGDDKSYQDVYAESSLIITDYSSSIYDFVYLRKPVVYCQFDRDVFFSGKHTYVQGDMDYERDGFGEVEYTLEDTVNRVIEYMKNDCQVKQLYRERMDQFFAYRDRNNCERVYQKIISR